MFEVYTDSSDYQLGGVIVQNGRPLAFYSRKLRGAQLNYTITENELLGVVETLKEFRCILLGHKIKVFTDHKNLEYVNSTATSQRAMRWRVLLEEFGPQITYIKGVHNTVADEISRLDRHVDNIAPYKTRHAQLCYAMRLFTRTERFRQKLTVSTAKQFADTDVDVEEICPFVVENIAHAQTKDRELLGILKEEQEIMSTNKLRNSK